MIEKVPTRLHGTGISFHFVEGLASRLVTRIASYGVDSGGVRWRSSAASFSSALQPSGCPLQGHYDVSPCLEGRHQLLLMSSSRASGIVALSKDGGVELNDGERLRRYAHR